jgi:branched-chain amino acid transport system permease protein
VIARVRARRHRFSWWGLLPVALLLVLPFVYHDQYVYQVAILAGIYMVLNMAMYLMLGQAGLVMLGQAGFYGLGAYVAALLALNLGLPFLVTFLAGGVAAALLALVVGIPSLRLRGIYFALMSLGFAEIVRLVTVVWIDVTRGPMGLPGIPRPELLGVTFSSNNEPYFFLMVLFVAVTYIAMRWIERSSLGLSLRAIRGDDQAAASLGINVYRARLVAFTAGCFFTGLVGAFYAHFFAYVGPSNFTWNESLLVLTMSMLGAFAGLPGALLAALLLTVAPELLRPLALYRQVFYAILLLLLVIHGQRFRVQSLGQWFTRQTRRPKADSQLQEAGSDG